MSNFAITIDKLLRQPYQTDKQKDIWTFYCPHCKSWHSDYRHGYSSRFVTQFYFTCPKYGTDIEAPGRI